jgi:hypothetical protein
MDGLFLSILAWIRTWQVNTLVDVLFFCIFNFWYYFFYGIFLLVDLLLVKTMILTCLVELIMLDHVYLGGYGTPTFLGVLLAILTPPLIDTK